MIAALRTVIKRMHYPLEVMLTCVRWYVSYPLSFRHLEEMMEERGVVIDHATIHRWAIKIVRVLPPLKTTTPIITPTSSYASASISTISSSKIIGLSNESYGRCAGSRSFAAHASSLPASKRCT